MKNTVRQFIAVGFGFAAFLVAFALGTGLTLTTGIPLVGGLVNGVFTSAILAIGMLSLRRFGVATTMWVTFSLLAIPTTTLGPPMLFKPVIGLVAGVIWDIVYMVFRRRAVGLYLGAFISAGSIMGLLILALAAGFGQGRKKH